jgi:hypothetical protein
MSAPEQLPEYHDDPVVDPAVLMAWLRQQYPNFWGPVEPLRAIGQVLQALQAIGDATLIKNDTYRSMLRDRADLERLAAYLLNGPHAAAVLEADGDPVTAAIRLISNGTA